MKRNRLDTLCVWMFAMLALLVTVLALIGGIAALANHFVGYNKKVGTEEVQEKVELAPAGDAENTVFENELNFLPSKNAFHFQEQEIDPDEPKRSFEAIMAKCQCVPDCYIVGYAPELVEGYKDEYRNENGMYMTDSGMWAAPGCTVATDPAVIPTGATVIIDGEIYIAADRGVRGKVIDVMVTPEEALTFGARKADVWWCMELEG